MPLMKEVLDQALQLRPAERVELADALIHSVDDAELSAPPPDQAWADEIAGRMKSADDGTARLYSWAEVKAYVEERLRKLAQ